MQARFKKVKSEFLSSFQPEENLFQFGKNRPDSSKEDADTSDSEESYYSGLESESETSQDDEDEHDSVRLQNYTYPANPDRLDVQISLLVKTFIMIITES